MTRAVELAGSGAPEGTVVIADFQRQGRGTRGRTWAAPSGTCLMFSVLVRPEIAPAYLEHIPLQVARSVAAVLSERTGLQVDVKEPNDVLVSGRKLCGVLCQSQLTSDRLNWLVCGIGLNTTMTAADLPLATATSLFLEGVQPVPAHTELLRDLLDGLLWLRSGDLSSCAE
jgi:BirA family transcriptional regulator, biotin operon repressor / biotin---[acetyl-CoA-carboxylase] ligase